MEFRSRRASRQLLDLFDQHARGISGYTCSGWYVPGHDCAGAHHGTLANLYTAQNRCPLPTLAPRPTIVSTTFQSASDCNEASALVARGYLSLIKITPWPIKTLSSIITPSQMKVWLETLQLRPTTAPFWISTNEPIFVPSPISQP